MNTQRSLAWLGFLGTAAVLAWGPGYFFDDAAEDGEAAVAVASKVAASVPAPAQPDSKAASLKPRDLFPSKSWKPAVQVTTVTEQPVVVAPVAQVPTAPALPFQFVGRLDDRADQQVFLQSGEKLYVVRRGDVIDDTYRIEQISATELSLVYLPLHLSQTLSVGSAP
ncbi:hypothetical protein [Pseudomonas rubra]|uniref:Secretion system X translation initiation factor n=1 Tax=Pseudomonas rubra TaxID=2942627 RepID=A0ABT5P338_9PSED|nr:hypothetical protein [Pseudomonas rubra]MDD1012676.1 hypothetical protein [Pseudomonas rubra]MDD1037761.1 hypothetical protein [Pseudomonas rubra]MDD1157783.1 hypothetical protein [Pseudomonas rubra]